MVFDPNGLLAWEQEDKPPSLPVSPSTLNFSAASNLVALIDAEAGCGGGRVVGGEKATHERKSSRGLNQMQILGRGKAGCLSLGWVRRNQVRFLHS